MLVFYTNTYSCVQDNLIAKYKEDNLYQTQEIQKLQKMQADNVATISVLREEVWFALCVTSAILRFTFTSMQLVAAKEAHTECSKYPGEIVILEDKVHHKGLSKYQNLVFCVL